MLPLLDILLEFTETVIHYILFVRHIYPQELFEKRVLYRCPTRKSRHPVLNDYISLFIEKLKSILEQGHASMAPKIILVIYNNNQLVHSSSSSYVPSSQVLEKYTIEMDLFFPQTQDISVDDLQVHLRSLLLKLSTISNKISSLPSLLTSDISWRLWINTGQESHPPLSSSLSDPNFFIPSPTNGTELDMNKSSSHCIALQSLPVSPSCNVQILVQEDIVSKKQLHNTANDSLFLSFPGSSLAA